MSGKNWYIGGLGIPKPHKINPSEWAGIIVAGTVMVLAWTLVKIAYDHSGTTGLVLAAAAYFVIGYAIVYKTVGGLRNFREGMSLRTWWGKTLWFVACFGVLVSLMALMWPLFVGYFAEEQIRSD